MYYEARYEPQNSKNLSDKAKVFVDKIIAVQDGGHEELTSGKKTVVYIASPNFGLIPNSDLKKISSIPFSKWTELSQMNDQLLADSL